MCNTSFARFPFPRQYLRSHPCFIVDRIQGYLVRANYIINILVIEMTLIMKFLQVVLIPINHFYVIRIM